MPLAIVYSRAGCGVEAPQITIEIHISQGLPCLSIVGLPEVAIKESKDRVRSALINTKFEFPARRITINLAPANLPKKDGGKFDLAIAIGILVASEQLPPIDLNNFEFAGELALDGQLRSVQGILPFALATQKAQRSLIVPIENADEAALVKDLDIFPVKNLLEACAHLTKQDEIPRHQLTITQIQSIEEIDLADVRGQRQAKRVLEIAAAGRHSLLMVGPPGVGKSMLASRLPTILPPMTDHEALETAAVYSIAGKNLDYRTWRHRPFRAPHHTASSAALVGGSNPPKPGEVSLAHHGVLFLDELPEFNRHVLEVLREPLESGTVSISRASYQSQFPARFQLVAAMNPCPCGYCGDPKGSCNCTIRQIHQYLAKISGPLLDRIDLHLMVPALPSEVWLENPTNIETSSQVRERVTNTYQKQLERCGKVNAILSNKAIHQFCKLTEADQRFFEKTMDKLKLSARAHQRILKVARTIADLENCEQIEIHHLQEALTYRKLER